MLNIKRFGMNLFWAVPIFLIVGCGGDGIRIVPVEGTVTLDGKPLDNIMVEFWPESDGPRSVGETDSSGHFVLTVDGKRQGASVGSHKVVLKDVPGKFMGRAGEDVDITEGKKSRISAKYASPTTTTISQRVEANGPNQFAFEVSK